MISVNQVEVARSRGCAACISAAHKMFYGNISKIFCHVWLYSLACALAVSVFYVFFMKTLLYGETIQNTILMYVSLVFAICLQVMYSARVLMLINGQTMRWNIIRYFRIFILEICIEAVAVIVCFAATFCAGGLRFVPMHDATPKIFLAMTVCLLVYGCFMLPFGYLAMKYVMEPDAKLLHLIFKKYTIGLRYWGFIFTTILFTVFCTFVITMLLSMPMVIISAANMVSVMGVKQFGDPAGLSLWFAFLQSGVTTLSMFISFIINVFFVFVYYFMYGSIETRVKEKTEYLKTRE